MPSADRYFSRFAGLAIYRKLSQPAFHPTRDPDRQPRQCTAEVLQVEPAMELFQAMNQSQVTGSGPLRP